MTTPHNFRVSSRIGVKDVLDKSFNSNFIVDDVPSSTTVTYSQSAPDASSSGGVATLATSESAIKVRVGAGWGQNDNTAILVYDQDSGIIPTPPHGIEFRKTIDNFPNHKINPSDPDIPWFGWRVQQASELFGLTNYPLLLAYGQTADSNGGANPPIWIPHSFYLGNALTGRNQFFKSSALPASGTHKRGDWAFNSSPTSGGVAAWVAVQDGTPGTWEPVSLGSGAGQVLSTFMPGALTTPWTGATWTPDKDITVTRIEAQAKTAPVGCTTNALVNITDGTRSQNVGIASIRNDSGPITQNYDNGKTLSIGISTAASGCTEAPADVNVLIQYQIQ